MNQLISENDAYANRTYVYTYDTNGNILTKKEYTYSTNTLGTLLKTITYTYGDESWGDLLTNYNGTDIAYDEIGNPLNWHNVTSMTWEKGRRLTAYTYVENGKTYNVSLYYNTDGIRTAKIAINANDSSDIRINTYALDGTSIVKEDILTSLGLSVIYYMYDAAGDVIGFKYGNHVSYFYGKNAQGDVVALFNESSDLVARYYYDAWGNVISIKDANGNEITSKTHIALINPIRYRSYYYDSDTGFYYLNTRYYDPQVGRFINADSAMGVNIDMATYNLFVYCGNNPVCRYDVVGMFWKEFIRGGLHKGNDLAVAIGIDTAAIGAFFLMMEPDDSGVYHARFDCWQQYAGYNKFYDFVFDSCTSMVSAEFIFSYDGCGYTIWAWKGDYINLGAGAELGIYRGSSGHRTVDTSLAMWMGMIVSYEDEWIIDYSPDEDQWWITGFNPKYRNVSANDLFVTIGLGFNDSDMYYAFKGQWERDTRWFFWDYTEVAILQF